MSNVTVFFGVQRKVIKTTPGKFLSEIRTEACQVFNLIPASSYILRRGGTKLDLSLPVRLTSLSPGARLDLARAESSSALATVTLRIVVGTDQIVGTFPRATTIWGVLRKVEADARTAGQNNVNITERCAPSPDTGSGRLLYQMPAVRVANRELAKFDELKKTLEEMGLNGRELLTIRFLPTEIPYEDALMEIAGMSNDSTFETVSGQGSAMEPAAGKPTVEKVEEDVVMPNTPAETSTTAAEPSSIQTAVVAESSTSTSQVPKVTVFQPSSSAVPTAAMLDVPDSAYDIGIAELRKIKDSYHAAAQPQRLLSDRELAEKDAAMRQEIERIHALKIKVRFPDGYISQQELEGSATARDLYTMVRSTLRYPNEPFILRIPPRDNIHDDSRRLTLDLRLRSGTSLYLSWSGEASARARSEPALRDELLAAAMELPKLATPSPVEYDKDKQDEGLNNGKEKGKDEAKSGSSKESMEKRLKGLLRLGKK